MTGMLRNAFIQLQLPVNSWEHNFLRSSSLTFILALLSCFWIAGCGSVAGNSTAPSNSPPSAVPGSQLSANLSIQPTFRYSI